MAALLEPVPNAASVNQYDTVTHKKKENAVTLIYGIVCSFMISFHFSLPNIKITLIYDSSQKILNPTRIRQEVQVYLSII